MYQMEFCGVSRSDYPRSYRRMCYEVDMYVARVPNRGSPPAILLRESYREGGKVKNRTLANLSRWPEHKVDALSRALKGLPPAGTFPRRLRSPAACRTGMSRRCWAPRGDSVSKN